MIFLKSLKKIFDFFFPPDPLTRQLETITATDLAALLKVKRTPTGVIALFSYRHPLIRRGIWEIKYRGNEKIAKIFARVLFEEMVAELIDLDPIGQTKPLITIVPMTDARRRARGFNHLAMLVKNLPVETANFFTLETALLKKVKNTPAQTSLKNRKERLRNPIGSFAVTANKKTNLLAGATVFVVDDVTTTGATLKEIRKVLRAEGVRQLLCFALAH
jgi:competence protein ComFC